MKSCVVLALVVSSTLCVTIESKTYPEPNINKDHFTAVCNNKTTATLTLKTGYVVGTIGKCHPKKTSHDKGSTYIVDKDCLMGGEFIIKQDPGHGIFVGNGSTTYILTCTFDDSNGYIANVSTNITNVKEPTVSPVSEKGRVTPPSISMEVYSTDPSTFSLYSNFSTTTGDVYLGQVIYLGIYHNPKANGQAYIFPKSCAAVGGKSPSLILWNLTDSKCFFEPSVLSGGFQQKHVKDEVDFAFAEMKAFQFQADPTETITFSCTVRICRSKTTGLCKVDSLSLTTCGSRATGRRRRDVMNQDDSPVGQGSLHHVTATLHIRDDIMSTGMASRFRYTVSCLVLPLLAVFVM